MKRLRLHVDRMIRPVLLGTVLALSLQPAQAGWREPREALDERLEAPPFRIFYTRKGEDAFRSSGKSAGEDPARLAKALADQLQSGHRFYTEAMSLTPPLQGRRYKELGAIDVHVLTLDNKGSTGDGIVTYDYRHFDERVPAMTISIDNEWSPGGQTPEHEVFHAYQYGYTFFKTSWFLEGMARSLESAFDGGGFRTEPLPRDRAELDDVVGRSYKAAPFWSRLMLLCNDSCAMEGSARRFYPKERVCGASFVKALLEEYDRLDDEAARKRGIDPTYWPEDEQRSEANTPWMLAGLKRVVETACPIAANDELKRFHKVLAEVAAP